jgi:hypothetical protein
VESVWKNMGLSDIISQVVELVTGTSGFDIEPTDNGIVVSIDVSSYLDADQVYANASIDDGTRGVTVEPDE